VLESRAQFLCHRAATAGIRLLRFIWMRAVAPDKASRRAVEMDPLATALPIADVVNQGRPCIVAAYPQSEPAIGTGDRFGRHSTRPRASEDGAGKHTEMGRERLPHFGGDFERGVGADRTLGIRRSSAVTLAESHGIPKLQVNAVLTGLVEQIWVSCRCASILPAWADTQRLARPSKSRPARRSPSARRRT
jgi:hypothetical protein